MPPSTFERAPRPTAFCFLIRPWRRPRPSCKAVNVSTRSGPFSTVSVTKYPFRSGTFSISARTFGVATCTARTARTCSHTGHVRSWHRIAATHRDSPSCWPPTASRHTDHVQQAHCFVAFASYRSSPITAAAILRLYLFRSPIFAIFSLRDSVFPTCSQLSSEGGEPARSGPAVLASLRSVRPDLAVLAVLCPDWARDADPSGNRSDCPRRPADVSSLRCT